MTVNGSLAESARTCSACRTGFTPTNGQCRDLQLQDMAKQTVSSGNMASFASSLAGIASDRSMGSDDVPYLVSSLNNIVKVSAVLVCVWIALIIIVSNAFYLTHSY